MYQLKPKTTVSQQQNENKTLVRPTSSDFDDKLLTLAPRAVEGSLQYALSETYKNESSAARMLTGAVEHALDYLKVNYPEVTEEAISKIGKFIDSVGPELVSSVGQMAHVKIGSTTVKMYPNAHSVKDNVINAYPQLRGGIYKIVDQDTGDEVSDVQLKPGRYEVFGRIAGGMVTSRETSVKIYLDGAFQGQFDVPEYHLLYCLALVNLTIYDVERAEFRENGNGRDLLLYSTPLSSDEMPFNDRALIVEQELRERREDSETSSSSSHWWDGDSSSQDPESTENFAQDDNTNEELREVVDDLREIANDMRQPSESALAQQLFDLTRPASKIPEIVGGCTCDLLAKARRAKPIPGVDLHEIFMDDSFDYRQHSAECTISDQWEGYLYWMTSKMMDGIEGQ
jgi:hypothetical protein